MEIKSPLKQQKNKQMMRVVAIVGIAATVIFVFLMLGTGKKKEEPKAGKKPSITIVPDEEVSKETWMTSSGTDIQTTKKEQQSQKQEIDELKKITQELAAELKKNPGGLPAASGPAGPDGQRAAQGAAAERRIPPPTRTFPPFPPPPPAFAQAQGGARMAGGQPMPANPRPGSSMPAAMAAGPPGYPQPAMPGAQGSAPSATSSGVGLSTVSTGQDMIAMLEVKSAGSSSSGGAAGSRDDKKRKEYTPYTLPSGSFSKVVLLSGMDAPTGSKGKGNPVPVLMRVTDITFMPNEWRAELKGCFVVGEGYGDLSAERAFIRLNQLSCINKTGKAIVDLPLKGYVVGEDGSVGLRGNVVSKSGTVLARAIMAGFLQGVSEAFAQSNTNVQTFTTGGVATTIDPAKAAQYGAYSGVGKAMEQLAKYYTELAGEIFPIVEVQAGRRVTMVLTSNHPITFQEVKQ